MSFSSVLTCGGHLKYTPLESYRHACIRRSLDLWFGRTHAACCVDRCLRNLQGSIRCPDWLVHHPSGRIRLYWALFGRNHCFFTGREAERERQPRLEIGHVDTHAGAIRVQVKNTGGSVARGCYGRIAIDQEKDDVVNPDHYGRQTFVTPTAYTQVRGSVSWVYAGTPALAQMKIPVGQFMLLEIARLEHLRVDDVQMETWLRKSGMPVEPIVAFNIPSEQGWGGDNTKSRALLRARTYKGVLIVGSDNTSPIGKEIVLMYDLEKREVYLQLGADVPTDRLPNQ